MTVHDLDADRTSHEYLGWRDGSCACSCGRKFDSVQAFDAHIRGWHL